MKWSVKQLKYDSCTLNDIIVFTHQDGISIDTPLAKPRGLHPFRNLLNFSSKLVYFVVPYTQIYAVTLTDTKQVLLRYIATTKTNGIVEASRHSLTIECQQPEQTSSILSLVQSRVEGRSDDLEAPKRRLYVVLNPLGGNKQALLLYHTLVEPMLSVAGITLELAKTEYALHAQLLTHELDLSRYQGLVIIGGDGLIHEAVNGLISRRDWNKVRNGLPIGIVPAGTSNAVARSLGVTNPVYATFSIIKQVTRAYDAVLYEQGERRFYGHFAFMWGLVADIDIGGNACRWLGRSRLFWVTLARVLRLHKYHAIIRYIDADTMESMGAEAESERPRARYKHFFTERNSIVKEIDDREYYSVIAVKHAYLDRDFFISNRVTTENGADAIHLFLVPAPGIKRWNFLKALFYGDGTVIHDNEQWTWYARVRACGISFREYEQSIVDIDGEQIPKLDIYMESIPEALCYFVPPH